MENLSGGNDAPPPSDDSEVEETTVPDLSIFAAFDYRPPNLEQLEGEIDPLALEHPTDSGNALRFKRLFAKTVFYVPEDDTWYIWDGKRSAKDGLNTALGLTAVVCRDVQEYAHHVREDDRTQWMRWADATESLARRTAMLKLAQVNDPARPELNLVLPRVDRDANPNLWNFPNCTLDVEAYALGLDAWHEHRFEDRITKLCPTPWDPSATSDKLDLFLKTFLPKEDERNYILQCLAVAIFSPGNNSKELPAIFGDPISGKSTLVELILNTLGTDYADYANVSIFRGNLDDKPRPDLLRVLDLRFVVVVEAGQTWELHSDHIKRMTGDNLTARAMRSNTILNGKAPCTLIVANSTPRIKGADPAVKNRIRPMIMDTQIAARDDDGVLRHELVTDPLAHRACLALLLDHFQKCGGRWPTDVPARFIEKKSKVYNQVSVVARFLAAVREADALTEVEDADVFELQQGAKAQYAPLSDFHQAFIRWAKSHAREELSSLDIVEFGRILKEEHGWTVVSSSNKKRWRGKLLNVSLIDIALS